MRAFIYLLLFALIYSPVKGQWYPVNLHADGKVAMAVTDTGTVHFTTVGGGRIHKESTNWNFFQTQFTSEYFADIDFPTADIGYACGGTSFGNHKNVIVKTTDGGVTWDSITSNNFDGYYFMEMDFFNVDTGFVSGGGGLIRTFDGGTTFELLSLPSNISNITELYGNNNRLFIASRKLIDTQNSYSYLIIYSDDYGVNWVQSYVDTLADADGRNNREINSIQFINNDIGYAVGGNGLFLKTTDGGVNWEKSFISPYSNLTSVWFTSESTGYVNNVGGIFYTNDGGENWQAQNIVPPLVINQIQFANDTVGYALGLGGLYRTINGGGSITTGLEEDVDLQLKVNIYPNPTDGFLYIEVLQNIEFANISLFDSTGKEVKRFYKEERTLNVDGFPAGTYFLNLSSKDGNLVKSVVIK